jgi:hypothetical protein
MFGKSKRDAEALAAIREEMAAAELRARAILADAVAKMELRLSRELEQRRRDQTATESAIETLRSGHSSSSSEVARALGQVANMCAIVAERLDADRLERRAFTEAIARATLPPVTKADGPSRIIGGTFFATSEVPDDAEISVVEPIEPIEPIEPVEPIEPDDSAPGAPIDATSRATEHLGTRLELSTGGEPSANGFQRQEAGEPRA